MFGGEIEVDESYFGGKVYTKIIPDVSGATLIPIIERKVVPASR
jgi:transposase